MKMNIVDLSAPDALARVRARIENEFPVLRREQPHVLELALNEAQALAWQTGFPHLVFPELALEKAKKVQAWHQRQNSIWNLLHCSRFDFWPQTL